MFFCRPDPVTQQVIPDLEPVKIGIRQFDERVSETTTEEEQILVSPFLGIKAFTHYLSTNPAIMSRDNASPGSLTMVMINKKAIQSKQMLQLTQHKEQQLGLLDTKKTL